MLKLLENDVDFKTMITSDGLVVVDFYADWCGPCRMLSPILDKLSESAPITVLKVDVDKFGEISKEYEIRSIPAVIIFKNGRQVESFVGYKPEIAIKKMIDKYL